MATKQTSQPLQPPVGAPVPAPKCTVTEQPDGGLQVAFLIEPEYAKRFKLRANGMPLDRYLWEQILKRAVVDHIY